MKRYSQLFFTVCCLLLIVVQVHAQLPGDPGGGDPDVGAPLDDGVLVSLIAGLGVGFYKFIFKKNKPQS